MSAHTVVFEDDFEPHGPFVQERLNASLAHLPADWEFLWLVRSYLPHTRLVWGCVSEFTHAAAPIPRRRRGGASPSVRSYREEPRRSTS